MGNSKVITILALVIGLSGLGMSGYTLFFALPVQTQSNIRSIWYVSKSDSVSINDVDTIIPDLNISATVGPGESLHILFNSDVFFYSQSGIEILYVYISLNGNKVAPPVATFGAEFGIKVWGTLTLQYSNLTISPGLYSIGIIAYVAGDATPEESLYDMTLLAFTCA
jgi:hypothetical protein